MSREWAWELLEKGEYGILSLLSNGEPYAVPMSYLVWKGRVYFHSALEGRKMEALECGTRAQLTVVGRTKPVYTSNFTTFFESAMAVGTLSLVTDAEEKKEILLRLAEKYLPDHMEKAEDAVMHSLARTAVIVLTVESVTGKAKLPKDGIWE